MSKIFEALRRTESKIGRLAMPDLTAEVSVTDVKTGEEGLVIGRAGDLSGRVERSKGSQRDSHSADTAVGGLSNSVRRHRPAGFRTVPHNPNKDSPSPIAAQGSDDDQRDAG